MEITRRRKASARPTTMEGQSGYLRMGNTEAVRETTGLETSQHDTTDDSDNTSPPPTLPNADTIT